MPEILNLEIHFKQAYNFLRCITRVIDQIENDRCGEEELLADLQSLRLQLREKLKNCLLTH